MNERDENFYGGERVGDLPVRAEAVGFEPGQMILCEKCARKNPPTRVKCFYCAAPLAVAPENAGFIKPNLRRLENWEKGFNLILLESAAEESDYGQIAQFLDTEIETLRKIFAARIPLPLVRAETAIEAEIAGRNLEKFGLKTAVVGDENLAAEKMPQRLRGLEPAGEKLALVLFNSGERMEIAREDLILIVTGAIFEKKTEAVETRKKGENKLLGATETASDASLIDVYTRFDEHGFRILAKGFDFSCLGEEKKILAAENIKTLAARLREFAPGAKFVNDYLTVRDVLGRVWEVEQRKDAGGFKKQGFGKIELSSVTASSNLQQFTKFSRLQQRIL